MAITIIGGADVDWATRRPFTKATQFHIYACPQAHTFSEVSAQSEWKGHEGLVLALAFKILRNFVFEPHDF